MRIFFKQGKWMGLFCLVAAFFSGPMVSKAQTDTLWGMTGSDGGNGFGDLFSLSPDGTNLQTAYGFSGSDGAPVGSLIQYKGILYGFTPNGGSNASGEIFTYSPATAGFTSVYSFDGAHGAQPNGKLTVNAANGLLYGVTTNGGANGQGVIFSLDPSSGTFTDLYDFNNSGPSGGSNPLGPLTLYNKVFYGRASGGANSGGVLFSFDPATNTYTDLYDGSDLNPFQSDASLVVSGNVLYGISDGGGANGQGVLFSFDPVAGTYTELVTFDGVLGATPLGIVSGGGMIYGVTQGYYAAAVDNSGELFSFNPATHKFSTLYQFSNNTLYSPAGNILFYNGNLLGMATSGGGGEGIGGIFSYNLATNTYTDITDFSRHVTGSSPTQCQLLLVHTVGTKLQTITFKKLTKTYGVAAFDPGAVASSGLPVNYSSDNTGVAVVSGNQLRIVGVGTAKIAANQAGNATYDSTTVTAALTVSAASLLITAVDTVRNQDQPNPVFRLAYTGLVNGDSVGSLPAPPVVSTTADSASLQGTYPITVGSAADSNYTITYQSGTLTVIGLLQHITFIDSSAVYGGPDVSLATATSGLPVTYTSSNPSIASVTTGQQLHILTAGTTEIIATQAGNADYAPMTDTLVFVVAPAPLSITADSKTKVYNQPDPVFTAVYSGFINGDDTNSLTAKPVFTTTAGPGAPPGGYVINVGGAADSNYAITYTSASFVLTPVEGDQVNSLDPWFSSPATLQVTNWMTAAQTAMLQVFDAGGHRLVNQQVTLAAGYNAVIVAAGGWATGIYIVRLAGDGLNLSKTIRKIN